MDRTILHADCNGFYASVECVMNPELRKVPMAVGGDAESRHGIILAKNELAKKYNIKTAETIWQAKRKCPSLVIVPPRHGLYNEYSKRVFEIYTRYTELVESFGLDEAWLDVTASKRLFGTGREIADELREVVKRETGLTISVGVSFCKVFAKLGSDYKKPDATTVFDRANWQKYIYPMSADSLLYVGKSTRESLLRLGIKTIGDLAGADRTVLSRTLGKSGEMLYLFANGLDNSPVKSIYDKEEVKSVGKGFTFREDLVGEDALRQGIYSLSDDIAARMRAKGLKCTTVQVQIKNPEFKVIQRQKKLEQPTNLAHEIRTAAMELIKESWSMTAPVRMLTVTGCNVIDEKEAFSQLSLFDEPPENREKTERLERTMDVLKQKYGKAVFRPSTNRSDRAEF
ncbi:MAG: DNA polymerase IV [Clostridiales bacterium]|nr:DNA polymerase IV [Clostridiales bacterium]